MTIRISAAHRDALYEQITDRLSGIGDVWLAVSNEDFDRATRLAREFSDDLRLVVDDLGWGDGPGRSIELTAPRDVLERAFTRFLSIAASQRETEEPAWAEARDTEERNRLLAELSERVLAELGSGQS